MLPPPGRLVDVGTHRLHLSCLGEGSPTVVLDSALGASSISWVLVQPALARLTRTCAYDRAGFGWSDAGPLPRTASRIANELYELLRRAQVPPPYVLVGHSFGGLVARLFAGRHPDAVAGMVLIEPAIAEHWASPPPEQQARIAETRPPSAKRYEPGAGDEIWNRLDFSAFSPRSWRSFRHGRPARDSRYVAKDDRHTMLAMRVPSTSSRLLTPEVPV